MRLSLYSVAAVLVLAAMSFRARPTHIQELPQQSQVMQEGAYRDGLYLGQLHRRQGLPAHPAAGRWSQQGDRQLFVAGYTQGYGAVNK
jgi:hypothetical protein